MNDGQSTNPTRSAVEDFQLHYLITPFKDPSSLPTHLTNNSFTNLVVDRFIQMAMGFDRPWQVCRIRGCTEMERKWRDFWLSSGKGSCLCRCRESTGPWLRDGWWLWQRVRHVFSSRRLLLWKKHRRWTHSRECLIVRVLVVGCLRRHVGQLKPLD